MGSWFLRIAATATVALVALAACGQADARFQRYGTPGYVAIGEAGDVTAEVAFDTSSAERHGWLIGPNFSLAVSGYSVTDSAGADEAAVYGFVDGPVSVASEYELFAAFIDPAAIVPEAEVDAVVMVDDAEFELEHLPGAGETIAAVIPVGADVVLSVTDEDRTQLLSLRDGSRPEAVEGFYIGKPESASPRDYRAEGVATGDAGAGFMPVDREIGISMTVGAAERSPWSDEHGWAPDGSVWVSVPVSDLATDAVWGFDVDDGSHEPKMYWELAERDLFSLSVDGDSAAPEGDRVFVVDGETPYYGGAESPFDPAAVNVVFEVPTDVVTVVFSVAPAGILTAEWADVEGSGSWKSQPETGEFEFSF